VRKWGNAFSLFSDEKFLVISIDRCAIFLRLSSFDDTASYVIIVNGSSSLFFSAPVYLFSTRNTMYRYVANLVTIVRYKHA